MSKEACTCDFVTGLRLEDPACATHAAPPSVPPQRVEPGRGSKWATSIEPEKPLPKFDDDGFMLPRVDSVEPPASRYADRSVTAEIGEPPASRPSDGLAIAYAWAGTPDAPGQDLSDKMLTALGRLIDSALSSKGVAVRDEAARLKAAIQEHHDQKADDRCIEDDTRLYAAAGLLPADHRVGDQAEMLKNCARFIERRCLPGGWPTYAQLEARIAQLEEAVREKDELLTTLAERGAGG